MSNDKSWNCVRWWNAQVNAEFVGSGGIVRCSYCLLLQQFAGIAFYHNAQYTQAVGFIMHKTQKLLLLRDHSREFQLKCDSDEVLVIVRSLWNEFSPVAQEIRHMESEWTDRFEFVQHFPF